MTVKDVTPFEMERLGVIMEPEPGNPREAWGVLNPGGARGPDGEYYLFPRVVAEGNYSRIGRARVIFDANGDPSGVERLGYALEPHEPYEVSKRLGGGVEDPRVAYLEPLRLCHDVHRVHASPSAHCPCRLPRLDRVEAPGPAALRDGPQ